MTYYAYTGIGSRDTPEHIMKIMHAVGAYLYTEGWTLRSGGAEGADLAFEQGAVHEQVAPVHAMGLEIYLPWKGFNHSTSNLHPGLLPFSQDEIDFAARYHPAWHRCSPAAQKMHTRNVRQIIGHESVCGEHVVPSKFVICWTVGGQLKGGTAQALRIAQGLNIPIINFGKATNPQELEALVLEVDRLQNEAKNNVAPVS